MSSDHRSAADRIVDLYRRHAEAWDSSRGRDLMEKEWLDRFLALVPAGGDVLDLGCGAGEPIAAYLVGQGRRVTGVDTAPALLARCRDRFPTQTFVEADMRTLALGRTFDGLVAWDSFFHLTPEDQRRMVAVFAAHAGETAALMFTSGPAHGVAMGTLEGEPLYHASLDPEEYRTLLGAHGFEIVHHVAEDQGCGGHTVWLARRCSSLRRA
ncbi:class I SAM-dependent DNA methyltransferase [Rhodoplanes roseus]|uniref:SAM-dependent methyltransferase n=1 Tax=Rhodoplanes roseus TaxID=29409 RepID=A0A327KM72_9BRAD|nr:class I SAM-dependent methyltransferase [Rhodoplanes roseus]RAI39899.1 SAM-dependent methyltransferase [Rhodoplanes roseus]